jgi:hypothetical protein
MVFAFRACARSRRGSPGARIGEPRSPFPRQYAGIEYAALPVVVLRIHMYHNNFRMSKTKRIAWSMACIC